MTPGERDQEGRIDELNVLGRRYSTVFHFMRTMGVQRVLPSALPLCPRISPSCRRGRQGRRSLAVYLAGYAHSAGSLVASATLTGSATCSAGS